MDVKIKGLSITLAKMYATLVGKEFKGKLQDKEEEEISLISLIFPLFNGLIAMIVIDILIGNTKNERDKMREWYEKFAYEIKEIKELQGYDFDKSFGEIVIQKWYPNEEIEIVRFVFPFLLTKEGKALVGVPLPFFKESNSDYVGKVDSFLVDAIYLILKNSSEDVKHIAKNIEDLTVRRFLKYLISFLSSMMTYEDLVPIVPSQIVEIENALNKEVELKEDKLLFPLSNNNNRNRYN